MTHTTRIGLILGLVAAILAAMPWWSAPASAAGSVPLTVTADGVNLRQGPGTGYAVKGSLNSGDQVTATGRDAGANWYQVQLANGITGWVNSAFASPSGDASVLPEVAAAAVAVAVAPSTSAGPSVIVFQVSSGGAIYRVNPDGTGLQSLTTGLDPALSPDGRSVAFTRWDNGGGNGALGSVWVINTDGSGERKILADVRQPKSPTWSPDGTQVAVSMQQGGQVDDINKCIALTPGKRPNIPRGATNVTTSNGQICFTIPANPFWGLRVVNLASGAWQDLPRDVHSFSPSWDPANPNLVVYHGDTGLAAVDLASKTSFVVTADAAQRSPAYSPDGSKIAVSYRQNDHWEVHVLNADGSGDVRLTETPLTALVDQQIAGLAPTQWNNAAPAWSPDGSQIAFLTDRTGQWQIWVMNADGSNQHPLTSSSALNGLNIQYNGVDERVISWR